MAELDLTGYHDVLAALIVTAKDLGWTVRQQHGSHKGRGGTRLTAPNSQKTVNIPQTTQMRQSALESLAGQIVRHTPRDVMVEKLAVMDTIGDRSLPAALRAELMVEQIPESAKSLVGTPVEQSPGPVHTRPSKFEHVLEVVRDDEVLTYRCEHCDYENDHANRVAVHASRKKDAAHGHAPVPEKKEPRKPTDAEILESVRRIVGDNGRVTELEARIETLESMLRQKTEEFRQVRERAEVAESNLQALRDLLNGVTS